MYKFTRFALVAIMISLVLGACETKQDTGTLLGAGAGALIGSRFGSGSGQVAATGVGAVLGALIGSAVGKSMDKTDQLETQRALENSRTNQSTTWVNPDTHNRYTVTPTRTYSQNGEPCRQYVIDATINGRPEKINGTACRNANGEWVAVK
ncbi:MAG: RT0821/Lpp0805 family surface protein [Pseudomonadota bacterium]